MKRFKMILAAALALLMLAGCGGQTVDTAGSDSTAAENSGTEESGQSAQAEHVFDVNIPGIDAENYPYIDGSTANHPLLARIYQEICHVDRETAESFVDFDLGSTGSIWENILEPEKHGYESGKRPDLLIVYEAPEDVKEMYADVMDHFEIEPLGRDGLVFLANAANPVESLTTEQLYGIYTDKIHNWSEVGGNDEAIVPFQRNEDSGSQTLFMKLLMKGEKPMDPPKELQVGTMGGLIDSVAAFDGSGSALGYSVYYYANLMYGNPNLKLLSVDGVAPSNKSIETGEYPLTNDFYVVIRADEPEDSPVRALRDWLLTDEGRALLEAENYVWARGNMTP